MMKRERSTVSKLFACLMGVYITCLLLSNLIAGKMMALGSVTLPAAVILFPVTYILADVFTEVYGFRNMRTVIWMGFACSAFAVLIYMITIALPHPDFWGNQEAFAAVLGTTPRVFLASLAGYLFGEFSNAVILSRLKVRTGGKKLWVRTIGSTIVGEAFDTVIFISLSFWGTMETSVLLQMMLYQYLFKVCYEVVFTPVTYAVVNRLKMVEGIDIYDNNISYNPFGEKRLHTV